MSDTAFRGTKTYRPGYLHRRILNQFNQKIAGNNMQEFPQLAIFSFDNIGLVINLEGRYERDSLDVLSRFLTENLQIDTETTVIDVGANIGNHSVFLSRIFHQVIAFEPNPKVFSLLRFNSEGLNIVPVNYGLSDSESILRFAINRQNLGASNIIGSPTVCETPSTEIIEIKVQRLDDNEYLTGPAVSLIKIDVEGHELQVLQGAVKLIEKTHPVVVFEQGEDAISGGTSDVINFLRERGYRFFTIQSNFYLGRSIPGRVTALGLRMAFGFRKDVVPTSYFTRKFYEMIIAVPG